MKKISIHQAGTSLGSFSSGAEAGPRALLDRGLEARLMAAGHTVHLLPEIDYSQEADEIEKVRESRRLIPWLQALHQQLLMRPQSEINLTIGGDHSVAIATLLAAKKRNPDVVCIYVDAHPDSNDIESSPTGNLHGMPLRVVTGEILSEHFEEPYFRPDEIILLGIKDIDDAEQVWLDQNAVSYFSIDHIIEQSIGRVMEQLTSLIKGRPVHISYDIDAIDTLHAPGTGIRNHGGLTLREASYIARKLGQLHPISIDLVEFNPWRDEAAKTADLSLQIITELVGGSWGNYATYLAKGHNE